MNASQEEHEVSNEEQDLLTIMQLVAGSVLPMVIKSAIELDLFEIMAKVGRNTDGEFTSADIVSHLGTQNPQAVSVIERILRFLAMKSLLTCKICSDENGGVGKKVYGMTSVCKYFVRDEEGVSFADFFLFQNDKVIMESWYHLKDVVLEGGIPFNKAHGNNIFEYQMKNKRFGEIFNKAMYGNTSILMKLVVQKYKGFQGVETMVDVGGGLGATLKIIVSKYPIIKAINFDLPHVIKDAPTIPGVEHVGGDMFLSIPKGNIIFMKWILHDWGDDDCIALLKNCWKSLPNDGKVIVLETIIPVTNTSEKNVMSNTDGDMVMLALNPGGKERTFKEYDTLAKESGFTSSKIVCRVSYYSIMEFNKNS